MSTIDLLNSVASPRILTGYANIIVVVEEKTINFQY